jgi:hypothetical protein
MKMRVVLDAGDKRVFATAIDWPGWSRGAKSREDALAALLDYGQRYKKTLGAAASGLAVPESVDELDIVASARGDTNTDFGVPHAIVDPDRQPMSEAQLEEQIKLLKAAWKAFGKVAGAARGKTLATGPRGGGRKLDQIVEHVAEADGAYIRALGAKAPAGKDGWSATQTAFVEALHAKLRGELPDKGPRGGDRWPARYAIRRSAWHALDHAWEIEDRSE